MEIAQKQHYEGDDWWAWSVWIEAPGDELDEIESVTWHLHPTFVPPEVVVDTRDSNFALDTAGWGTFRIRATVRLKGG
jgi:transcription initiation factor IIF auxiliary subunit